ncbi:Protein shuttle craft [Trachymyrmex septentrionalis]|uniref:Protein shuttle craft n=1 Tax=Trachymyrmex septentrionalis TaxID=34720 RepID=A0A195F572_9HYME|nr:Protein shuttle craft [Trachymyrmex septentrionalis]
MNPVPICTKRLKCGQPNNPHIYKAPCHVRECPGCDLNTDVKCCCDNMDRKMACKDLTRPMIRALRSTARRREPAINTIAISCVSTSNTSVHYCIQRL